MTTERNLADALSKATEAAYGVTKLAADGVTTAGLAAQASDTRLRTASQLHDLVATMLVEGSNINIGYDDEAGTITVAVEGLGRFQWVGLWNNHTDYIVGDVIFWDVTGSSYLCALDDSTHAEPDLPYWHLLAAGMPADLTPNVFAALAGHFLAENGVIISLVGDDYTWSLQYADDGIATAGRPVESTDSRLIPPTARDLGVPRSIGWFIDGDVAVVSGHGPIYKLDSNLQFNSLEINVKTVGVGATKMRLYSSSDLTSWASVGGGSPQCTVASGSKTGTNTYPDPTRYAAGTWLRLDVDEVGGTAPKNATIQLFGQLYPEP